MHGESAIPEVPGRLKDHTIQGIEFHFLTDVLEDSQKKNDVLEFHSKNLKLKCT
jgi:hypothetical protein